MQVAEYLGLRVHEKLELHDRTLFIPRFDRQTVNGKVKRIAQKVLRH